MTKQNKQYWFKRHRYGYGWIPVTRQGILLIIIYMLVIIIGILVLGLIPEDGIVVSLALYLIGLTILTSTLLRITRRHAPRLKWRWGKSSNDNPREDF